MIMMMTVLTFIMYLPCANSCTCFLSFNLYGRHCYYLRLRDKKLRLIGIV